jgi:hypothetical protein
MLQDKADLHAWALPQALNAPKLRSYGLQMSPAILLVQKQVCFSKSCLSRVERPTPLVVPSANAMASSTKLRSQADSFVSLHKLMI